VTHGQTVNITLVDFTPSTLDDDSTGDDEAAQFNTCPIYAEMYIGAGMGNLFIYLFADNNNHAVVHNNS